MSRTLPAPSSTLHRRLLLLSVSLCLCGTFKSLARPPSGPYEPFRVVTDNIPSAEIDGWFLPAQNPHGTVFVLHGYNNGKEWMADREWIRDREGWNMVMIDFREHGKSTRTRNFSTLGYHEIWDVKAAVDWADQRGLPRPYVIYGRSMGAATGLRFASMDRRISGVFAISPFKNAELATRQMADYGARIATAEKLSPRIPGAIRNIISDVTVAGVRSVLDANNPLSPGLRDMLKEVDIPAAVARRNDLRIWILSAENDSFPPADQRAILDASASPPNLKRLVVAPGLNHHTAYRFQGNADLPSHDQYLHDFLVASGGTASAATTWPLTIVCATIVVALISLAILLRKSHRPDVSDEPVLPPPTNPLQPTDD